MKQDITAKLAQQSKQKEIERRKQYVEWERFFVWLPRRYYCENSKKIFSVWLSFFYRRKKELIGGWYNDWYWEYSNVNGKGDGIIEKEMKNDCS